MGFHDWRPSGSTFPEMRKCEQCGLTQVFWVLQSSESKWVDIKIVIVGPYSRMGLDW